MAAACLCLSSLSARGLWLDLGIGLGTNQPFVENSLINQSDFFTAFIPGAVFYNSQWKNRDSREARAGVGYSGESLFLGARAAFTRSEPRQTNGLSLDGAAAAAFTASTTQTDRLSAGRLNLEDERTDLEGRVGWHLLSGDTLRLTIFGAYRDTRETILAQTNAAGIETVRSGGVVTRQSLLSETTLFNHSRDRLRLKGWEAGLRLSVGGKDSRLYGEWTPLMLHKGYWSHVRDDLTARTGVSGVGRSSTKLTPKIEAQGARILLGWHKRLSGGMFFFIEGESEFTDMKATNPALTISTIDANGQTADAVNPLFTAVFADDLVAGSLTARGRRRVVRVGIRFASGGS